MHMSVSCEACWSKPFDVSEASLSSKYPTTHGGLATYMPFELIALFNEKYSRLLTACELRLEDTRRSHARMEAGRWLMPYVEAPEITVHVRWLLPVSYFI